MASEFGLFSERPAHQQHIAIVLDEQRGMVGIVTSQDLLEEIICELDDPFLQESEVKTLPDGTPLIDGLIPIEDFSQRFNLELQVLDHAVVAGFVHRRYGRLTEVGDTAKTNDIQWSVETIDGLRTLVFLFTQSLAIATGHLVCKRTAINPHVR